MSPSRKYQNEGGPGPREIARLLREAMPAKTAEEAVQRFADALIWNWLIGGTDAHAKNYSLLLSGSAVRLAPPYDVASALPYGTHERRLRFAMKTGEDYRVYLERNPWSTVARELALDPDALLERARELAAQAPDAISDAARSPEIHTLGRDLPSRLSDLVADRSARCLKLLETRSTARSADGIS